MKPACQVAGQKKTKKQNSEGIIEDKQAEAKQAEAKQLKTKESN